MRYTTNPGSRQTVERIMERLAEASIGQTVSYAEINQCAGYDVYKQRPYLILKAVDLLKTEHAIVFQCQRKTGYERMGGAPGVEVVADTARKRTNSSARRGVRRISGVLPGVNNPEARRNAYQTITALNMSVALTQKRTVAKMPETEPEDKKDTLRDMKAALGL